MYGINQIQCVSAGFLLENYSTNYLKIFCWVGDQKQRIVCTAQTSLEVVFLSKKKQTDISGLSG